jgi:hypothetical protein
MSEQTPQERLAEVRALLGDVPEQIVQFLRESKPVFPSAPVRDIPPVPIPGSGEPDLPWEYDTPPAERREGFRRWCARRLYATRWRKEHAPPHNPGLALCRVLEDSAASWRYALELGLLPPGTPQPAVATFDQCLALLEDCIRRSTEQSRRGEDEHPRPNVRARKNRVKERNNLIDQHRDAGETDLLKIYKTLTREQPELMFRNKQGRPNAKGEYFITYRTMEQEYKKQRP